LMILFFQAEDGIRDGHVTGVQTCALPISSKSDLHSHRMQVRLTCTWRILPVPVWSSSTGRRSRLSTSSGREAARREIFKAFTIRSEERRVGKECRYQWWRDDEKKKNEIDV